MKKMARRLPFTFRRLTLIQFLLFACLYQAHSGETPLIFPVPQQMELSSNSFVLDESVSIIVPSGASDKDLFLARFLVREVSNLYDLALKIESRADIPKDRKVVVMGTGSNPLIKKFCADNKLSLSKDNPGPEGYLLEVSDGAIVIAGSDDQGAFFGLQSLRQLMQAGNGRKVQGVKVRDWPALPFRGIRLYVPGPDNIPFFKRFLRDFMSLYKYNKIIIEFNCMRLDKHPEVNTGWIEFSKYMQYTRSNSTQGIHGEEKNSSHYDAGDGFILEKEDVRDIVDYARENFIEVIPEIPSLTHGYYLLTRHPELAEYPGDRWPDTYCPSNPKSYDLMFDVYDEYIDVIKPKMIHIGHDEWWGAPLGVCPLCKGKDPGKLFAQDVTKIHDYLGAKGIKVAMWGDYILESVRHKGTQKRVSSTGVKYETPGAMSPEIVKASVPKDILVLNWFWDSESKEMELNNFGFNQIYGNFEPTISNWSGRIKKINVIGGAPSSWAATNEFNFGKDLMLDFLGCANLLWSAHAIKPEDLPSAVAARIPSIRASLSGSRIPSEDGNAVEPVDISAQCNLARNSDAFGIDMTNLNSGKVTSRSKIFDLSKESAEKNLIAVGSKGVGDNPFPGNVTGIPIHEDVSSLIFLQASALPGENQKGYFNIPDFFDTSDLLGWYEVVYEDGYKVIVPVQYGVNILEWNPGSEENINKKEGDTGSPQKTYCYASDAIDCSANPNEVPITFYAFEWVNPRFGKVIKEVNLHGSVNYQSQGTDYGTVVSSPMKSNGILLAAVSKVKKRAPFKPE
jgi:hypothetical protein